MQRSLDQVLTVAQMRAAEDRLIASGSSVDALMQVAGRGAADWVWRLAGRQPVTVLCGPGNNGGDGYVIAEAIRERGGNVTVIAALEPKTDAARTARKLYCGQVLGPDAQIRGEVLVDCLFGSGLTRPLAPDLHVLLQHLASRHRQCIAIDVPSGVESDSGALLNSDLPGFDLTLALGAWKFAHFLMPASAMMGALRLVDIGAGLVDGAAVAIGAPAISSPAPDAHKYRRGLLAVVGGAMPGAALLACEAAQGAGAGYVKLFVDDRALNGPIDLVIDSDPLADALTDDRNSAILCGPGLGRDDSARERLAIVLAQAAPAVLDADALVVLGPCSLADRTAPTIATPHEGELAAMERTFACGGAGTKPERAFALAKASGMVVVAKGPDTVVAAPDGRIACAPRATSWLSTAGTGDVLAGAIASRLATGEAAFDAACQGVWLHGEAARNPAACIWRGQSCPRDSRCAGIRMHRECRGHRLTDTETIVRVAAKGDGITASGRFASGAAPGDVLHADGSLEWGPHHAQPPCRHFGTCGGCQLQHLDEQALAEFVTSRVVNAASGQELAAPLVAPPYLSPPRSRRRASLHGQRMGGRIVLGFSEAGSHRIVDMLECHVLRPELFALVAPLRQMLGKQKGKRLAVDIELALSDQGLDVGLKGLAIEGLDATEAMLDFARDHRLARLTIDQGFGPEAMWEPQPVTVSPAGTPVSLPPGAFQQATADGEAVLIAAASEWLEAAGAVADLFSGLGTFAFALAGRGRKVLAVEAAQDAHLACKSAAGRAGLPVHALHRDLFRNPLRTAGLNRFDAVVLDPPRAGAREQVQQIAQSTVPRVGLYQLQPFQLGPRRSDFGGGRLPAGRTASSRPVPLVHARGTGEFVRANACLSSSRARRYLVSLARTASAAAKCAI